MKKSFGKTQRFIDDFDSFIVMIDNIKVLSATKITNYFNDKISHKKIKIFLKENISFIEKVFRIKKTIPFLAKLSSEKLTIQTGKKHPEKEFIQLAFEIDSSELTVKVNSSENDNISSSQIKYIQEFEYALTLAYRLNVLSNAFESLKDLMEPLIKTHQILFSGSAVADRFQAKQPFIEEFLKTKINYTALSEIQDTIDLLIIYKNTSIESILYNAYNEHIQGKGLVQRAWQNSVIGPIAQEIDPKCYFSNNKQLTGLFYPVLKFPNMKTPRTGKSRHKKSNNKIQAAIQSFSDYLKKSNVEEIVQEFKIYSKQVLLIKNVGSKVLHYESTYKLRVYKIQQSLTLQDNKLQQLRNSKFSNKVDQYHYDISKLLIKFIDRNIKFNAPSLVEKNLTDLQSLYQYVATTTDRLLINDRDYDSSDLDNAMKTLAIIQRFAENKELFHEPNLLDKILAFIHKLIPLFKTYFEKCEKYNIFLESERCLTEITKIPCH